MATLGVTEHPLFPSVFEVLMKKGFLDGHGTTSDCGLVRRTCKSWRQMVDNYFDQNPYHVKNLSFGTGYDDGTLAQNFLAHFQPTHQPTGACPFFTKTVQICLQIFLGAPGPPAVQAAKEQRHYTLITEMLTLYGRHIKHLQLTGLDKRLISFDKYLLYQQLLNFTPNIISLELSCPLEENKLTEQQLLQIVFPPLPNLRFVNVTEACSPVCNALLQACPQVGSINLDLLQGSSILNFHQLYQNRLENLKKLTITSSFEHQPFVELLSMPGTDWPLEEIDMECRAAVKDAVQFFELLNRKWCNTLKKLVFALNGKLGDKTLPADLPKLKLHKVQEVRLLFRGYQNLEFLLGLEKTLKKLDILFWEGADPNPERDLRRVVRREKKIKIFSCLDNPMESNVWTVFPRLQQFDCIVQKDEMIVSWNYSREQWQRLTGNR